MLSAVKSECWLHGPFKYHVSGLIFLMSLFFTRSSKCILVVDYWSEGHELLLLLMSIGNSIPRVSNKLSNKYSKFLCTLSSFTDTYVITISSLCLRSLYCFLFKKLNCTHTHLGPRNPNSRFKRNQYWHKYMIWCDVIWFDSIQLFHIRSSLKQALNQMWWILRCVKHEPDLQVAHRLVELINEEKNNYKTE